MGRLTILLRMLPASIGEVAKAASYDEDAFVRRGQPPSDMYARSVALSKCPLVSVGSDHASHWTGVVEGEDGDSDESSSLALVLTLLT